MYYRKQMVYPIGKPTYIHLTNSSRNLAQPNFLRFWKFFKRNFKISNKIVLFLYPNQT